MVFPPGGEPHRGVAAAPGADPRLAAGAAAAPGQGVMLTLS